MHLKARPKAMYLVRSLYADSYHSCTVRCVLIVFYTELNLMEFLTRFTAVFRPLKSCWFSCDRFAQRDIKFFKILYLIMTI